MSVFIGYPSFMAYQMMKGKKGNNDDFPSITGMIARYSASGLTNEQMAANPVWVDKTGNGHDLQLKNFAWKEGSGISDVYPGFILGDGVDDFAVTEKELNFEDTYTVYTAFIPFQADPVRAMEMCGKDFKKDFYLYYSTTHVVYYTSGLNNYIPVRINQFHIIVCKRNKTNAVIKNLITGESKTFSVSELIDNPGVYYLWRYQRSGTSTAKTAIAGQTICNGYFSTDEDDEKVLDWYKKQMPWLFPDQAWTVTGKTNEDADRATIANITGNGNDLVLSNFGFAEGSGYGLYGQNYISYAITNRAVYTKTNSSIHVTKSITAGVNFTESARNVTIPSYRIKVTGIQSGQEMIYRGSNNTFLTNIPSDGIYVLPAVENGSNLGFQFVSYTGDCDITIEQIPEYEGYLITDGVDDKVESSPFTFNKDWTIVGNWTMLSNIPSNCGIIKVSSMFLYNSLDGVTIYFAGGPIKIQSKSINAFCSDGRIYLNDWTEILKPDAQIASGGSKSSLYIASYSASFTKMAFKNLAIYDGKNLSKDDCIKAYKYLQTLKAK